MLPDYPKTKALIQTYIRERMAAIQQSQLGAFSAARAHCIAEGLRVLLHREDGCIGEIAPKPVEATAVRARNQFDVMAITLNDEDQLLSELGTKMAMLQSGMMIESIDEMVTKHGNFISSNQSVEDQYLEGLSKILMGFNNDGEPILPMYFSQSPEMQQRLENAAENVMTDPVLRRRYEEIIELKRQEWNEREAARNMVE